MLRKRTPACSFVRWPFFTKKTPEPAVIGEVSRGASGSRYVGDPEASTRHPALRREHPRAANVPVKGSAWKAHLPWRRYSGDRSSNLKRSRRAPSKGGHRGIVSLPGFGHPAQTCSGQPASGHRVCGGSTPRRDCYLRNREHDARAVDRRGELPEQDPHQDGDHRRDGAADRGNDAHRPNGEAAVEGRDAHRFAQSGDGGVKNKRTARPLPRATTIMDARTSAVPCDTTRTGSGAHLKVVYDSVRPGISERVIYPFGVYASQGFWYCFCHDYRREENYFLKADRSREVEPIEGFERPPHVPSSDWDARSRVEEARCSR